LGVDFCNCPRVCPKLFPELIKVKEGFISSPKIISPLIILVVFAAITVLLSTVFGKEYLPWFFALDYTGYLLTPVHDCVMIGKRYFGTSYKTYYTALIAWALLLISVAGAFTFIK